MKTSLYRFYAADAGFDWVKRTTLNDNLGPRSAPKQKDGE